MAVLGRPLAAGPHAGSRSFGGGRLVIDRARHETTVAGRDVVLTPTEWQLLEALAGTPGRVFSRRELRQRLAGPPADGDERAIDSHVKNLRHKLGAEHALLVETVVGFGYRLGVRPDA